ATVTPASDPEINVANIEPVRPNVPLTNFVFHKRQLNTLGLKWKLLLSIGLTACIGVGIAGALIATRTQRVSTTLTITTSVTSTSSRTTTTATACPTVYSSLYPVPTASVVASSGGIDWGFYGTNVLINGDAEIGLCASNSSVQAPTSWKPDGLITQILYNNSDGDQTLTSPGPSDRGRCYFYGQRSSSTSMSQTIDLLSYSLAINNYTVTYNLSAWLGGYTNQNDSTIISLKFLDMCCSLLGTSTSIGPVTAVDRSYVTSLKYCSTTGVVLPNTRYINVRVVMTRYVGGYNDGDADNISLELLN
ncbi:unnamed protein product, partial [Didymodactylos carnosus]